VRAVKVELVLRMLELYEELGGWWWVCGLVTVLAWVLFGY